MAMLNATAAMQQRWGKPGLVKRFRGAQTVELEVERSAGKASGGRRGAMRLVQPVVVEAVPAPAAAPRMSRRRLRMQLRAETDAILAQLREMFPAGFTEPPVPLAVGLRQQLRGVIRAAIPPLVPERKLKRAIAWWCNSPAYLAAVASGQQRRNIDGTPSGDYPTAEHIADARKRLGLPVRPVLLPRELRGRAATGLQNGHADVPYAHTERRITAE